MRACRALAAAALAAVSLAAAAPAADGHDDPAAAPSSAGGAVRQVTIPGTAFAPERLDVLVGDTVTWTNADGITHTVTARDDAFDSGFLGPGATFTRTFERPATIPYVCTIHKFMTGTLRVVPVAFRGPEGAVRPGGSARITGLAPQETDRVTVERLAGRRWVAVRTLAPVADGTFALRVRLDRPEAFRARVGRAVSATVRVAVAPRIEARRVGGVVRATSRPRRPGAVAVLQRYDRDHFTWRTVARTRVGRDRPIELPLAGSPRGHLRVVVRGGDGWADGASPALRVGRGGAARRVLSRTVAVVPLRDLIGPIACALAAACLIGAMAVDLDSTAAKVLMVCSAVLFVPGAVLTLVFVRRYLGPPL